MYTEYTHLYWGADREAFASRKSTGRSRTFRNMLFFFRNMLVETLPSRNMLHSRVKAYKEFGRPDNRTPLIDPLSANDSQNNPGFNSIILKTISGSIYHLRLGLYSTPTPFDIIECSNYRPFNTQWFCRCQSSCRNKYILCAILDWVGLEQINSKDEVLQSPGIWG